MRGPAQLTSLVVAASLLAAACSSGTSADDDANPAGSVAPGATTAVTDPATPLTVPQVDASPPQVAASALQDRYDERFPDPLVDPVEIRSGGPPPDGIPSIDAPTFLKPGDVAFLEDTEPVLALQIGDDARAYPVQILIWHEIVNDTVGGIPVAVTYCPLCNSAIAYDRRAADRVLEFGTSGLLYNSALVMYDRQTESLWSQFTAQAVIGQLTGTTLAVFPVFTVSWADWRDAHPDGLVLSRQTGFDRDYGRNPYPGYDDVGTSPFLFDGEVDGRLAAKQRVLGIEIDGDAVALRLDHLRRDQVRELELGGRQLVAWVEAGTVSALEDSIVSGGRNIGATGVFSRVLDGDELTFRAADDGFEDRQTGSTWNVLGEATDGPLAGRRLEPIAHVDTFWFAWAAFQPDTTILE